MAYTAHTAARDAPAPTWKALGDKVKSVVTMQIEDELRARDYSASAAQEMATTVSERCMICLRDMTQDFKVIVNTTILQKTGAGLHTVSSCYWDGAADGR